MSTTATPQPKKIHRGVPQLSAFALKLIVCPECAQVVFPSFKRHANGKVTEINYYHANEAVGCAWKLLGEHEYARQQCLGLQEMVRDGVDANGKPKFVDELEFAKGTSFDMEDVMPFSLPPIVHRPLDTAQPGERFATRNTPYVPGAFAKAGEAIKNRLDEDEAAAPGLAKQVDDIPPVQESDTPEDAA